MRGQINAAAACFLLSLLLLPAGCRVANVPPAELPEASPPPVSPPAASAAPSESPELPARYFSLSDYTTSFRTDGELFIVPDMRLSDLPEAFRNSLMLIDDTQKFPEGEPDRDAIVCRTYRNDDLEITTIAYDSARVDRSNPKYSDAGVEYIRTVEAISGVFFNYTHVHLGDPASAWPFLPQESGTRLTAGLTHMEITTENGRVTRMFTRGWGDMEMKKYKNVPPGELDFPLANAFFLEPPDPACPYAGLPDPGFPVPSRDGETVLYRWTAPPEVWYRVTTYVYDLDLTQSYQAQLRAAGFAEMTDAGRYGSRWQRTRAEDGATLTAELYHAWEGFAINLSVNAPDKK